MQLLLIGCGKLGKVFLKVWLKNNTFSKIVVVQPSLAAEKLFKETDLQPKNGLIFCKSSAEIPEHFRPNFIVIAAKPQILPDILHHYKHFSSATFISLAAGISTAYLQQSLDSQNIVRIMPNVAAQIGASVNLAFTEAKFSKQQKHILTAIFAVTGKLIWLDNENLIDLLTSIAGSGSAYVFLFMQSLIKTAMNFGLDAPTASEMVRQMVLGSALLAMQDEDLEKLIISVASKGGVTEAALGVLNQKLPELLDEACIAANARLRELQK